VRLIVRGNRPAAGSTMKAGDHVYVLAQPEDKGLIQVMLGRPEAK
jgi:hypothetical protein